MKFQMLGPLEVRGSGGRLVRLGGIRQNATLGYLLLHSNQMVSVSRLMDAVWPAEVPLTGRQVLYNAVFRLRGALAEARNDDPPVELLRRDPGYLLRLADESIDFRRFQALAERGRTQLRAGLYEQASDTLRDALSLWRGQALADLVERGYAWPELQALDNARTATLESRIEAEVALRRYGDVIADLEALLETDPLREHACGMLMRALYQCGRQADALSLYRRTRTVLMDELGLEPSPQLRDLEMAILNHALEPDAAGVLIGDR